MVSTVLADLGIHHVPPPRRLIEHSLVDEDELLRGDVKKVFYSGSAELFILAMSSSLSLFFTQPRPLQDSAHHRLRCLYTPFHP